MNKVESLIISQAHDMWSLAIVMFNLCNGQNEFPFQTTTLDGRLLSSEDLIEHIVMAPEYLSNYKGDDGRTNVFVNSLLVNDWKLRPTANEALTQFIYDVLANIY